MRTPSHMSKAEKIVRDYFDFLGLAWEFERPVVLRDDAERVRIWSPDYYLPTLGIYIEVASSGNDRSYDYRASIYDKNSIPIVFIDPYSEKDWKQSLNYQLKEIHQDRWYIIKSMSEGKRHKPKSLFDRLKDSFF